MVFCGTSPKPQGTAELKWRHRSVSWVVPRAQCWLLKMEVTPRTSTYSLRNREPALLNATRDFTCVVSPKSQNHRWKSRYHKHGPVYKLETWRNLPGVIHDRSGRSQDVDAGRLSEVTLFPNFYTSYLSFLESLKTGISKLFCKGS